MNETIKNAKPGAWNPGIESAIPERYLPLATIYRQENVSTTLAEVRELADFTGLPAHTLIAFRPERLIVHEVLIRVMADISVPDGKVYEDLGINFRRIVGIVLSRYVAPKRGALLGVFSSACEEALKLIEAQLAGSGTDAGAKAAAMPQKQGWLARIFRRSERLPRAAAPVASSDDERIRRWSEFAAGGTQLETEAIASLVRVASLILGKRGRLMGDNELIAKLALADFGNGYGSRLLGEQIGLIVQEGARKEGFKLLPAQEKPVILNVKGASAAGKSTLRPQQKALVERLKLDWSDFALISPDVFRKYLLDYGSLDVAVRYAGSLSGHEVEIVDLKLDDYMAAKAGRGEVPHLLIDRFRFDSFSSASDREAGGRLLTRFGDTVYLFFMITPPADTVERAWYRGEQVGRYKAVDDLLFHNIEAFSGMPNLFFTWALGAGKQVHYEFLDNSVSKGNRPRTAAFGANGELTVLDVTQLLNVERYKKVNVEAASREQVFEDAGALAAVHNLEFLQDCCRKLKAVRFADQTTGEVYAWIEEGVPVAVNRKALQKALEDGDTRVALSSVLSALVEDTTSLEQRSELATAGETQTLGAWSTQS